MQVYNVPHDSILKFSGRGKKAPGQLLYEEEFANSEYVSHRPLSRLLDTATTNSPPTTNHQPPPSSEHSAACFGTVAVAA